MIDNTYIELLEAKKRISELEESRETDMRAAWDASAQCVIFYSDMYGANQSKTFDEWRQDESKKSKTS